MHLTVVIFRSRISFGMARSLSESPSFIEGTGTVVGYPDFGNPPIHRVEFKQPKRFSLVKAATNLGVEVFRPIRPTRPQSVGR